MAERRIDLNADLGESFGSWSMGADEVVLAYVSSANIACGFHAGDPVVIDRTVALAVREGVAVGAHPGYPDLRGFGRREMAVDPVELEADILYQTAAVAAFARSHGTRLTHVKPHGALYSQAARDETLARAVARGVARLGQPVTLVGLAGSAALRGAALEEGLRFAAEAFVDRGYDSQGRLLPRSHPDALVADAEVAAARAVRVATEGWLEAADGSRVEVQADTLCLHGDGAHALEIARAVRGALDAAGVRVQALEP